MAEDKAYTCAGSCRKTTIQQMRCKDRRCNLFGEDYIQVPVVYRCPKEKCAESSSPKFCEQGCDLAGKGMIAKARVPFELQCPILNPPEESRSYSSIWDNNTIGIGHARSMIFSPQAWSAKTNDANQWVIIDAGKVINAIGGIVISPRFRCHQLVTKVGVDVAVGLDSWTEVLAETPTNLVQDDENSFV